MVRAQASELKDMRARILAAATRLFAAHGFDGTALQDVADAVSVSKPAVIHHYPSKEHLRQAVLDGVLSHWKETLPRLLLSASASNDRFEAVFGELHAFFSSEPDRARVVLREVLDRPEAMRELLDSSVRPYLEAICAYIRNGQASGRHYPDVDPEAYLLHVAQLVIAAAASVNVTAGYLGNAGRKRYDAEIRRMARTCLFQPQQELAAAAVSTPRRRRS